IIGNPLRKIARKHEVLRRLLWRVDFVLIWSLLTLFRLLPVEWASALGAKAGAVIGPLARRKNTILKENFRFAFPEKSPLEIKHLVKACWSCAGRVLAEYPHLDRINSDRTDQRLEIVVREPDLTFRNRNRPAIVVGAHLSNWELSASALGRLGIVNSVLYTPLSNPWLDRMLRESRAALNCELLPRDNSARLLIERLNAGRTIGMLVDRPVRRGKPIPFFGKEKPTTVMPAKLALKFDCDLIPSHVERIKGVHFRVTFHPPVRPANPGDCKNDQALDMMRQLHQMFESWIRQRPEDWFCSKRSWPKARPGNSEKARRESE
ncbi:MAG TPA: lysophospholipid acyltransferase family protein, partial [Gammaproteobacteria bacterium]|nr:lysophospholipid acyltransferase family protein [Gammaproteobacteria bacterium]